MLHTCYSLFTCSFLSGYYPNPTAFISLSKPNHERQILENAQKVIHIWANSTAPFMLSITYTWPVFSFLSIFLLKRISRAVKSSFSCFFFMSLSWQQVTPGSMSEDSIMFRMNSFKDICCYLGVFNAWIFFFVWWIF